MTTFSVSISESGAAAATQDAGVTSRGSFALLGGSYAVTASATAWGAGTASLQKLAGDGSTYVDTIIPFTANGVSLVQLPRGTYRVYSTVGSTGRIDIGRITAH